MFLQIFIEYVVLLNINQILNSSFFKKVRDLSGVLIG
mgnify:CR=1